MSEQQKPVEVAPVSEPVAETKVEETTPEVTTGVTTEPVPAVSEPTATTEAVATEETPKKEEVKEVTPVEEGFLEHKGSNFPKNFLYSKKFLWFGSEPVDTKSISHFKADKVAEAAHHIHAWAAETGKGLLFFSEKSEKSAPHGAISLAEVSEPAVEGTNKFHFTVKGQKHNFRAANTAERDNWVSQLKAKIAEAKELATTVTESETYKKTLESFKPAPVAKKEEVVAAPAAEPTTTEAVAAEETAAPKEAEPVVPVIEEPKKSEEVKEVKKEEPKSRSASRKRASIFGGSFFGKKEEKKDEKTETPATESAAAENPVVARVAEAPVIAAPVTEAPATEEAAVAPAAVEAAPETTAVVPTEPVPEVTPEVGPIVIDETKAEERKSEEKPVKATANKRGSIFSTLSFGKKEKASTSDDEEKVKSPSPFSKLRATIKSGNKPVAATEKPVEEKTAIVEPTTTEATKEDTTKEETPKVAEPEVKAPVAVKEDPVLEAVQAEKPLASSTPVISTAA